MTCSQTRSTLTREPVDPPEVRSLRHTVRTLAFDSELPSFCAVAFPDPLDAQPLKPAAAIAAINIIFTNRPLSVFLEFCDLTQTSREGSGKKRRGRYHSPRLSDKIARGFQSA